MASSRLLDSYNRCYNYRDPEVMPTLINTKKILKKPLNFIFVIKEQLGIMYEIVKTCAVNISSYANHNILIGDASVQVYYSVCYMLIAL